MKDVIYLVVLDPYAYEIQAAFHSFQDAVNYLHGLSHYPLDFSEWRSDLLIPYKEPVNGRKYSDFIIVELEVM